MITSLFMVVVTLVSLGFSGLVAVALVTYIRRTWQVMRSQELGSAHGRLLDAMDQLHLQNHMMMERLERLDRGLERAGIRIPPSMERPTEEEPGDEEPPEGSTEGTPEKGSTKGSTLPPEGSEEGT